VRRSLNDRQVSAVVLALTRHGPLIESGGQRWLMSGAPPLPTGANLTLEYVGTGAPRPARLLAVDARALAPVAIRLQPAVPPPGASSPPAGVPSLAAAVPVETRLIGPAGRPLGPAIASSLSVAGLAAAPGPAPPASSPAAGIAPQALGNRPAPAGATLAATAAAIAHSPAVATANDTSPGSANDAGRATAIAPVSAAAIAPAAPGRPAAPPAGARPPVQVSAGATLPVEVVDRDPQGRLLLQSGALRLRLETRLDLPLGARLAITLPQGLPALSAARPHAADPVRRLMAALLQRPDARVEVGIDALPPPAADHALAARLLRWIQTLAPAPSAAEGAPEPGSDGGRVRAATAEVARPAGEPQRDGWRVLVMPIGLEDPQVLKLHLRAAGGPDRDVPPGRDHGEPVQRAIFEVELSHLGRCQLDVLCQAGRFDLVVRSAAPLGPAIEGEIRGLIAAAHAAAGLTGRLDFRAAALLTLPDPLPATTCQVTA
jgi:hypothetical protein